MDQLGFYFDMTVCIGCKTCQIACKDKNDFGPKIQFRQVKYVEGGRFPNPWLYYISLSCGHCAAPGCIAHCRTGALHKDEATGAVLVDKSKCSGCRECLAGCPYGVPQYAETSGKMLKCDMCRDLIADGGEPACSASCPMRALTFGSMVEFEKHGSGKKSVKGIACGSKTNPSFLIRPKPQAVIDPGKETD